MAAEQLVHISSDNSSLFRWHTIDLIHACFDKLSNAKNVFANFVFVQILDHKWITNYVYAKKVSNAPLNLQVAMA